MYTNIDQKLVNSLHGLLNCELAELDCQVITTEYRTCVQCIHVYQLFCNALVRVIYFGSIWSMYSYNTCFFYELVFLCCSKHDMMAVYMYIYI